MCPDPQILSIYTDGELPSPWKEKMESHLSECSMCREKFKSFKALQELFHKSTHHERTFVERASAHVPAEYALHAEQELMEEAKEKVWKKLQSRRRPLLRSYSNNVWQRRISVPLPAAAAAAVVIALMAAVWLRGGSANNNSGYASIPLENSEKTSFTIAAEEKMPSVIPASDLKSVLQYLGGDHTEIIILQLPESSNFLRSGEPAMIRAADYVRGQP
jgi:anti-sigma factor RsiW